MSRAALVARCPAKVNLGLYVLGRRDDGYHELRTVFQTIDLEDVLLCSEADGLALTCDDPAVPDGEANLVWRTAARLRDRFPSCRGRGASFTLRKSIPAGGGLGGGSSDAAGALLALERLWDLAMTPGERLEIAAEIGSDVPFFLEGGRALGRGRGEILDRMEGGQERSVVVATPPFPLATAEVYAALGAALTPPDAGVTVSRFLVKLSEGNDFARAENDLERAAFAMRPELSAMKRTLARAGASPALLSGSGSSVFGMFVGEGEAGAAAATVRSEFPAWTVRVARTSPHGARLTQAGS